MSLRDSVPLRFTKVELTEKIYFTVEHFSIVCNWCKTFKGRRILFLGNSITFVMPARAWWFNTNKRHNGIFSYLSLERWEKHLPDSNFTKNVIPFWALNVYQSTFESFRQKRNSLVLSWSASAGFLKPIFCFVFAKFDPVRKKVMKCLWRKNPHNRM